MYKKLIGILVMTLLIMSSINVLGMTNKKILNETPSLQQNGSVDQEMTTNCGYGMILSPPYINAQSFKPSKESLTSVDIWLFKVGNPPDGVEITVEIRDDLDGSHLTSKTIYIDDFGNFVTKWIKFNFDDIAVIPEETYYIVCYADGGGTEGNCYCWLFDLGDKYSRGEAWWYNETSATWITTWELFDFDPEWEEPDLCFKTYFGDSAICCDGNLRWENVPPGDTVSGTFEISNCGHPESFLNWYVDTSSLPTWGTWTFAPGSGEGVSEGDSVTITVSVIAPTNKSEYTGNIIVKNSDDLYDFCEIDVYLNIPRSRETYNTLFQRFFERFPNAFPIIRQLIGYF